VYLQGWTQKFVHLYVNELGKLCLETLRPKLKEESALTYSMTNRCEAIIAADGMQKYQIDLGLTLNP